MRAFTLFGFRRFDGAEKADLTMRAAALTRDARAAYVRYAARAAACVPPLLFDYFDIFAYFSLFSPHFIFDFQLTFAFEISFLH
jgi:hypothetical protein